MTDKPYNPFAKIPSAEPKSENIFEKKNREAAEQNENPVINISDGSANLSIAVTSVQETVVIRKNFSPDVITKIDELTHELKKIKSVTNQAEADQANQVLKKSKSMITLIDNDRKAMTQILDQKKDEIIFMRNQIVGEFEKDTAIANGLVTAWLTAEHNRKQAEDARIEKEKQDALKKQQDEINRKSKIQNLILDFKRNVLAAAQSSTINDIDAKIDTLAKVSLTEATYMEFLGEAQIMYQECVTMLNNKKTELMRIAEAERTNQVEAERLKLLQKEKDDLALNQQKQEEHLINDQKQEAEIQAHSEVQMHAELKKGMSGTAKGGMKRWTFNEETINMALLPLEYHTFDEKKIKAAIAAGERNIPGVDIHIKISNVSR